MVDSSFQKDVDGNSPTETANSACTYCGLPVAPGRQQIRSHPNDSQSLYCCYGCRFAHAVVQERGTEGAIRWTVMRLGLAIFFTMNLMAFTMTMWSLDVYEVEPDPFQIQLFEVFRWLSMVFALPVLLLLGLPLLQNAVESWKRRDWSTDLLICLAVLAAYSTSVWHVVMGDGAIYFEVGAMVLVMVTLGRWIEAAGRHKATEALDELITMLPESVTVLSDHETESTISASDVQPNDLLRIRAGERFPVDGIIFRGDTTVDEQVYTGESVPVCKSVEDSVLAGTTNIDGDVVVRATAAWRQGSFGRLLSVLQNARNARGYYQRFADRVAAWFFPVVALVSVAAFAWHMQAGIGSAIQVAMSVLLIACPCALGLATPLAVWSSLGTALRHQVLFRSGEAIERFAGTRVVCLDKTGTLTTGAPHVVQTAVFGETCADDVLPLAAELATASSHPFSVAVARFVAEANQPVDQVGHQGPALELRKHSTRTVSGGGVEAVTVDGTPVRLGSVAFSCCALHQDGLPVESSVPDLCVSCSATVPLGLRVQLDRLRMAADQQAASIVLLTIGCKPAMGFLITEDVRPEAESALSELAHLGLSLHVLSGDRPSKGRFMREQLPIPGMEIECSLTPEQKVQRVISISEVCGSTVMVGDGINDAPALAASDVGVAMGCGTDVSRDAAQVCLLGNDLTRIPWALNLARRTRQVIQQNLFWAFAYNTLGVILAAAGVLNPAIAAGLMIGSSLLVISNSLRLLREAPTSTTDQTSSCGPRGKQPSYPVPPQQETLPMEAVS